MSLPKTVKFLITMMVCASYSYIPAIGQMTNQETATLKAYTKCDFEDGLKIVDVKQVVIDGVESRSVQTASGPKTITRIGSFRVMAKYPKDDYYLANIRPERSFAGDYENDKHTAIDALSKINEDDALFTQTRTPVMDTVNGFEVYKTNRTGFRFDTRRSKNNPNGEIDTVGIDIIFSDRDQTITTVYYFNTRKPRGKALGFASIDDWLLVRDRFLKRYTQCINANLRP